MHRTAPHELDVSIAAMCMIGLLKFVERLRGESASDIVWQSSPIKGDVLAAIRYKRIEEYRNFLFLREKYPDRWLPECPSCGVQAVVSSACEACFTELDHVRCRECDEEIYFMASERLGGSVEVECPQCGLKHTAYETGDVIDVTHESTECTGGALNLYDARDTKRHKM